MPVMNQVVYGQTRFVHIETKNRSFLDMHYYLKDIGIKNNDFFLTLLDPELRYINPHDPNLNTHMKQRILIECKHNYWYFLREVVKIVDQGGSVGNGVPYRLHRGNLALNFGFMNNWNMFLELPRQNGKTISAAARYLWVFNFGTTNSEIMFINKKHDDSKINLQRLKELRENLPSYLRMDAPFNSMGKVKIKDTVEVLEHPINKNRIRTLAGANSKGKANSLGRG